MGQMHEFAVMWEREFKRAWR